jgi:hypothetical protein
MSACLGLLRQRTVATAHIGRVRAHNARGRASKLIYWHPAGGRTVPGLPAKVADSAPKLIRPDILSLCIITSIPVIYGNK